MFWVRLPPRCRNFSGTVSHERTISNDFIRHIRQWMESFMALADGKPVCMMLTEAICSWILLIYNNTKKYWLLERWLSSHILHYVKATSLFTKPPFSSQNHLSLHKATSLFTKPPLSSQSHTCPSQLPEPGRTEFDALQFELLYWNAVWLRAIFPFIILLK